MKKGKLLNEYGERILKFCNFGDCNRVAIEHIRSIEVISKDVMTIDYAKNEAKNGRGKVHNEYRCGYHRQLKFRNVNA